jgi:hypothetical protein
MPVIQETSEIQSLQPIEQTLSPELVSALDQVPHQLYDLTKNPYTDIQDAHSFSVDNVNPLLEEESNVTLAVVDLGGAMPLRITGLRQPDGSIDKNILFIGQDTSEEVNTEHAQQRVPVVIMNGREAELGRKTPGSGRLGLNSVDTVSGKHLKIGYVDGIVTVTDLRSANGTRLLIGSENTQTVPEKPLLSTKAARLGATAAAETIQPLKPEFQVGADRFRAEGHVNLGEGRKHGVVLTSLGLDGKERTFFVYDSHSEGGYRSSLGMEQTSKGDHFLKGNSSSQHYQYTQDNQLHPEFVTKISEALNGVALAEVDETSIVLDDAAITAAEQDFSDQMRTYGLPDKYVNEVLAKLSMSYSMSSEALPKIFGVTTVVEGQQKLMDYVNELNTVLEDSGNTVMPDFKKPTHTEIMQHPQLGPVTVEVFHNNGLDWHMASDKQGRVWIDRIRFSGSDVTPYGTDAMMAYSGILTTKPLEYKRQVSGLHESMRKEFNRNYSDISNFTALLRPVQSYKMQRALR